MNPFVSAIAAAVEAAPMSNGEVSTIPDRLLLADGDGLAYYCAGKDDTEPGVARANMLDKLRSARAAAGAERVKILLTASGSHKGFRYAVARAKPYQGQRTDSRRPANWQYLRGLLEAGELADWIDVELTTIAEADDLFARYAKGHPDCVIYTQDKDMRMVEGWHLDWLTHIMFHLEPGTWAKTWNDKLWGRAWFWSQMLHGDAADNIPGLPFYKDGSILKSGPKKGEVKEIPCGEKSGAVVEMLPQVSSDMGATLLLQGLYKSCYGERWLVEMLEQGILLWMRSDDSSSALNVVAKGNPLYYLTTHEHYPAARAEVMARIAEAMVHEETEDNGSCDDESDNAPATGAEVRSVLTTVFGNPSGAGPRPCNGVGEGGTTPGVQLPVRQGGEQPQEVRSTQPASPPAWAARLFAKA